MSLNDGRGKRNDSFGLKQGNTSRDLSFDERVGGTGGPIGTLCQDRLFCILFEFKRTTSPLYTGSYPLLKIFSVTSTYYLTI